MTESVLALEHISKSFEMAHISLFRRSSNTEVMAVRDVSLTISAGEILGLVGQSGSGKTTTGRIALRLADPTAGRVVFAGRDITNVRGARLRAARRDFQMIHQDPYQSLNPRMSVREVLEEPLNTHERNLARSERHARVRDALTQVNLSPVDDYLRRYPYELSGGQRQRVAIARAVILRPRLVIADEPVSMLDVSVRSGILRLLLDLRDRLGTAQLFITHDLAIARHVCDRVAVMHDGQLVEEGHPAQVLGNPRHPYTRSLVDAIPERRLRAREAASA